jgi:hypothetical protein
MENDDEEQNDQRHDGDGTNTAERGGTRNTHGLLLPLRKAALNAAPRSRAQIGWRLALDGCRNLRELLQPMLACRAVHHMQ